MEFIPTRHRGARVWATRGIAAAAVLAFAACSGESLSTPDDPNLPGDPPVSPAVAQAAWRFDVNLTKKSVKITPPAVRATAPSFSAALASAGTPANPSLVGADVINLVVVPGSYVASGVGTGGASPGKVLVTFDVQIVNLLSSVDLITPTFPTPPSGVTGILMFPFATNVTTTTGGANGSGNDVIVDLPSHGQVTPSSDWSGAPHNFFNDTGCPAGSNDCYRYENYAAPLAAGATSVGQKIGFEIDPTVFQFSSKQIVAADLQNSGPALTRTVSGTVSSPQLGNLTGGTVAITGAGNASPSNGAYSVPNVGAGAHTVSYTPPAGCTAPANQNVTITAASPSPVVVDFTVTCTAPTGTVNGQISFQSGSAATPSLTGVSVTVTPAAAGTSPSTTNPNATGAYSRTGVAVGTGAGAGNGSVSFANLPAGCAFVGASTASYTGLTNGGTVTAGGVTIDCAVVLAPYPVTYTWGSPSGGSITLNVRIDMNAQNDPLNNGAGADLIIGFQGTLIYPTARLSNPSCTAGQLTGVINTATAGQVNAVLSNVPTGVGGLVNVYSCTFSITGTGPTATSTSGHNVAGPGNYNFTSKINVTSDPVP